MKTQLNSNYAWLGDEPGPQMLHQGLALLGTVEFAGKQDNPIVLAWAREVGHPEYTHDEIAWCGLFIGLCAKRANWEYNPQGNCLWARNWLRWGVRQNTAMLGDVLVFARGEGGHVAQYVGEDESSYHILGGNQSDQVSIVRKSKLALLGIRRAPWRTKQPDNIRVVHLAPVGTPAGSEA